MDGHEALADLKQISVQIEAAVIADHGGVVLACSPDDGPTGELLGGSRVRSGRPPTARAAIWAATR